MGYEYEFSLHLRIATISKPVAEELDQDHGVPGGVHHSGQAAEGNYVGTSFRTTTRFNPTLASLWQDFEPIDFSWDDFTPLAPIPQYGFPATDFLAQQNQVVHPDMSMRNPSMDNDEGNSRYPPAFGWNSPPWNPPYRHQPGESSTAATPLTPAAPNDDIAAVFSDTSFFSARRSPNRAGSVKSISSDQGRGRVSKTQSRRSSTHRRESGEFQEIVFDSNPARPSSRASSNG